MIEYFEQLTQEEQEDLTDVIRLLYRQTFLLERKFDKRAGRLQYQREYRICEKHIDFLKMYFQIAGITLCENVHLGLIYIQDEMVWGEKLPRLATIYILLLKLIYDEQMSTVSTSVNAMTNLSEIHEKLNTYRLLKKQPSNTEIRRSLALLKRYQIVEPLDVLDELDGFSRLVIYPAIHVVLLGDDARALLNTFSEGDTEDDEPEI